MSQTPEQPTEQIENKTELETGLEILKDGPYRAVEINQRLTQEIERLDSINTNIDPAVVIQADTDLIQFNEVMFTFKQAIPEQNQPDRVEMNLKIEPDYYPQIRDYLRDHPRSAKISLGMQNRQTGELIFNLGSAYRLDLDKGISISLIDNLASRSTNYSGNYLMRINKAVDTDITYNKPEIGFFTDEIQDQIEAFFAESTGVEQALHPTPPDYDDEAKFKNYCWFNNLDPDELNYEQFQQAETAIANYLPRQIDNQGHLAYTEPGVAEALRQEHGEFGFYHEVTANEINVNDLINLLANGITATSQRFLRGMATEGKSSFKDLETGAADAAFARIINSKTRLSNSMKSSSVKIILAPELVERTDFYAFSGNNWGDPSLREQVGLDREQLVSQRHSAYNEQVFRQAIDVSYFRAMIIPDLELRQELIDTLSQAGIDQINDQPVSSFLPDRRQLINPDFNYLQLANNQPPNTNYADYFDWLATSRKFAGNLKYNLIKKDYQKFVEAGVHPRRIKNLQGKLQQ